MNMRKGLLLVFAVVLSLAMMGCPEIINLPPEIVVIEDGEIINISEVTYEHEQGTAFDPIAMLEDLIENQGLAGIDYIQSGVAVGEEREYENISDEIKVTSFYDLWTEGEDANFDGVIDDADEEYWGLIQTDEDGNYVFDEMKIFLVGILAVGNEMAFTLHLIDEDGDSTEVQGQIVIV